MSYFVKIANATDVRKRVLESSKDVLHMLRSYHRLLELRDQKREVAEQLEAKMKELARLAEELAKLLPEKSLEEIKEFLPKPRSKRKKTKKETKQEEQKPEMNEVERLEKALANIEERLSKL